MFMSKNLHKKEKKLKRKNGKTNVQLLKGIALRCPVKKCF